MAHAVLMAKHFVMASVARAVLLVAMELVAIKIIFVAVICAVHGMWSFQNAALMTKGKEHAVTAINLIAGLVLVQNYRTRKS